MRLVRGFTSAMLLLLGGIMAHHLAGNSISEFKSLIGFLSMVLLISGLLSTENISETRLFFTVFIAQNGAHLILGGSIRENASMFVAHTMAGVLSFIAISKSSKIIDSLESIAEYIFNSFAPRNLWLKQWDTSNLSWVCSSYLPTFKDHTYNTAFSLRAPPAK